MFILFSFLSLKLSYYCWPSFYGNGQTLHTIHLYFAASGQDWPSCYLPPAVRIGCEPFSPSATTPLAPLHLYFEASGQDSNLLAMRFIG